MNYPRKVYAIRHNVTGRVYIGSSCRVDRRFQQHISDLRCHRHPVEDMQADFDQYGEDFSMTILEHVATNADRNREYLFPALLQAPPKYLFLMTHLPHSTIKPMLI